MVGLTLVAMCAFEGLLVGVRNDGLCRDAAAREQVQVLSRAVRSFALRRGRLPDSLSELAIPGAEGKSELAELPLDPWGHDYVLEVVQAEGGPAWIVMTLGPDATDDTIDDIVIRGRRWRSW